MKFQTTGMVCLFVIFFSTSIGAQETMFVDRSVESGLQGDLIYRQLGVSWADVNNDGLQDVFIATYPINQLFINQGGNVFSDEAELYGVDDPQAEAACGVWGDYDGDGDLDLFVGNLSMVAPEDGAAMTPFGNRLYRNDGAKFTDVAAVAGVSGIPEGVTGGTTSCSWADYDGDGWLDLLVCNRLFGVFLYHNQGDGTFVERAQAVGLRSMPMWMSYEHGAWCDYDRDGDEDLFLCAGEPVMMNMDSGSTTGMSTPMQMAGSPSSNRLYQNQGDGTFINVTESAGLVYETNMARTHTAVWGDYNNDGWPDLFSGNRGSITMNTVANSRLYLNRGDGTFVDQSEQVGIVDEFSVFGADWADVDNNGWLDLYIAIHPDMRDYPDHHINPTRIPHPLYMARDGGVFENVDAELADLPFVSGITDLGHQGGAVFADSDNDGDLDLVVVEAMGLGPMRFYENTNAAAGAHWIEVELHALSPNVFAVGAKIIVTTESGIQYREVGSGAAGWGSQAPFAQHFGLGDSASAQVKVIWPNGDETDLGVLEADQKHAASQAAPSSSHWALYLN